jgi:hypothetical protein
MKVAVFSTKSYDRTARQGEPEQSSFARLFFPVGLIAREQGLRKISPPCFS